MLLSLWKQNYSFNKTIIMKELSIKVQINLNKILGTDDLGI